MLRTASLAVALIAGLGVTAAEAHPQLVTASPAQGAKLSAPPKEIRMSFSEKLILNFSGLELKDGKGKIVSTGKAALAPGDDKRLVVPVAARLAPGAYTVAWHAVSVDTHRVTGRYGFTVARK